MSTFEAWATAIALGLLGVIVLGFLGVPIGDNLSSVAKGVVNLLGHPLVAIR